MHLTDQTVIPLYSGKDFYLSYSGEPASLDEIALNVKNAAEWRELDPKIANLVKAITLWGSEEDKVDSSSNIMHFKGKLAPIFSCEGHLEGERGYNPKPGSAYVLVEFRDNIGKEQLRAIVDEFNKGSKVMWTLARTDFDGERALTNVFPAKTRQALDRVHESAERFAVFIFEKWKEQMAIAQKHPDSVLDGLRRDAFKTRKLKA